MHPGISTTGHPTVPNIERSAPFLHVIAASVGFVLEIMRRDDELFESPVRFQVITGSYLIPKDKGPKDEEDEDAEEEEEEGYEFVKDYKFNIVHYVSELFVNLYRWSGVHRVLVDRFFLRR